MMVMLANNTGWDAGVLHGRYGDRVGHLYSTVAARKPRFMPQYALDNGRFPCWSSGKPWDEAAFLKLLESHGVGARWVLCPDVVADRDGTLAAWVAWSPRLTAYPLAFAVQDGMTASDVPADAQVVFVGGTTEWKRRTLYYWPQHFQRVHVGRINTERWLWECHDAGVESCDGTGWFRGDPVQFWGLVRYLERSSSGLGSIQGSLFEAHRSDGNPAGEAPAQILTPARPSNHKADRRSGPDEVLGSDQACGKRVAKAS